MSKADVWMPLYVADYHRDTGHLTTLEHGAYLLLLMQAWTRDGALPTDDKRLAALARCTAKQWAEVREAVLAFFVLDGDTYRNGRLDRERERAQQITEERRKAGAIGAAKRWAGHGKPIANAMANASQPGWQTDAPSQSHSQEKNSEATPLPADAAVPDAREVLWTEGLRRLRRITGKPDGAARGLLGRMCRDAGDDCALVSSVLHEAERDRPGDPIAWITAAIQTKTGQRRGQQPKRSKLAWMFEEMAAEREDARVVDAEPWPQPATVRLVQ